MCVWIVDSKCYIFRGLDDSEESDSDDPQIWQIAVQNCKGYGNGYSLVTISDNIEHGKYPISHKSFISDRVT